MNKPTAIGVLVVLLLGSWLWFGYSNGQLQIPWGGNGGVVCTEDAKICPDGSGVGREGPNCEFAACPDTVIPTPNPNTATFSASPTSGNAPLRVLFRTSVDWSNAYTVDFGDGVSSALHNNCPGGLIGACGQPTAEHTYAYSGTYTAQLIENNH